MSTTDQQILDQARASLLEILATNTSEWSENRRMQRQLEIDKLQNLIERYEERIATESGRRSILMPIRRVNI